MIGVNTMQCQYTVIGIASSGLHSNGFSLVRKVVFEMAGLSCDDTISECDNHTVGDILLTPTRLYARAIKTVLRHYRVKQVVHGIAHITGGGLSENLSRIVPSSLQLHIDRQSWSIPPVFKWVQHLGSIEAAEMDRVFNMGIGMALVVAPHFAESIRHQLRDCGYESWVIGTARTAHAQEPRVILSP